MKIVLCIWKTNRKINSTAVKKIIVLFGYKTLQQLKLKLKMKRRFDERINMKNNIEIIHFGKWLQGNIPTADGMEVKHGEWLTRKDYEDNYQTYACYICDNSCVTSHNEDDTVTLYRTKYCPNCGAKMDKGV